MLKSSIKVLDTKFLGGVLEKTYVFMFVLIGHNQISRRLREKAHLRKLSNLSGYGIQIFHHERANDELARLCDLYGSDKGEVSGSGHPYTWASHSYTDFYSRLFSHCRESITKVFECGIGTNNPNLISSMGIDGKPGASLRVWRDYFPNALVVGADIDSDVLFEEDRIRTHYVNQLEPESIENLWNEVGHSDFELMVDDGLHTFEAGATLWANSIDKLAPHGVYIIEDVFTVDLIRYREFFEGKDYIVDYVCLARPNRKLDDNNLVVIRKRPKILLESNYKV